MQEQYDSECATCGLMASEHIGVTSICKILRAVSNREASLIVERDKLKRELTEAREQRDRLAEEIENLKASGIHTCHDQCKRPMCVMRRERDRLQNEREFFQSAFIEQGDVLSKVIEQRDRLAEALDVCLREMLDVIYACNEEIVDANDTFHQAIKLGQKTLAAVKGGSDE
jgi:predicted  nucleic acid-binding Zn-ribbon protein